MEPIKRKKTLEQAYQSVADGISGKKENSCYEPIFVLDEEWNTLKQQERECPESPISKEEITNQRAKWDLTHEGEVPCATYNEHNEHNEHTEHIEAESKKDWNQWEALKQLRINPRIPFK